MRRADLLALLALPFAVAGCGGGGGDSAPTPVVTPLPVRFDVQPCLDQVAAPGATVANLVIPDTLKLDITKPSAFPNGRTLSDPVVDIMIAFAFTDLTKSSARAVANLPLDPSGNDVPLRADFPYLGLPQGSHPAPPPSGPNYNFRSDPVSMYVRVDRMGMPAVATLLIGAAAKTEFNDDDPSVDATRKYVTEIQNDLAVLTNGIAKDIVAKGFPLCAKGL
jgi:hypothetical protein